MSLAEIFHLYRIFYSLHKLRGIGLINNGYVSCQLLLHTAVHAPPAKQNAVPMKPGNIIVKIVIRAKLHSVFLQIIQKLRRPDLAFFAVPCLFPLPLCKKHYLFHGNNYIGKNDGEILHVVSAQIKKPCNIVKGG